MLGWLALTIALLVVAWVRNNSVYDARISLCTAMHDKLNTRHDVGEFKGIKNKHFDSFIAGEYASIMSYNKMFFAVSKRVSTLEKAEMKRLNLCGDDVK